MLYRVMNTITRTTLSHGLFFLPLFLNSCSELKNSGIISNMKDDLKLIRNFSIIAHIDHGKSTLADRFIVRCGGLAEREMEAQVLDTMDIERERGITIKAQSVTLSYEAKDGQTYQLNFIDTPGHVDFCYEVSRSLAACEGVLLVVDAAQGVEAQTVAVCYTAVEQGLEVLPVLNKIDLPQADPARVIEEIEEIIGIEAQNAVTVSAKTGVGVDDVLERLIRDIPPPTGDPKGQLQALIIDSWFDSYLGVVSLIRIKHGTLKVGEQICVLSTGKNYRAEQLGIFTPKRKSIDVLRAGEVGFLVANIRDIFGAPVGDTVTHRYSEDKTKETVKPLPGFKKAQQQVYAGLFPINSHDFTALRESLEKLRLNDAALFYEPERSTALGNGFRCGFLGLLHMEIVQERLEREYDLSLITTAPSVKYQILLKNGEMIHIDNPARLPTPDQIDEIREPIASVDILVPQEYVGAVIKLCMERRGVQKKLLYVGKQISLNYEIPLREVIADFFDKLKSLSRGFASLDYHFAYFKADKLQRLDVLINGDKVDAFAQVVHKDQIAFRGRQLAERLRRLIPRQQYDVAIQAAIGGQIVARQTVKAYRKDVTAKCYGGDISRKKKLLQKQKKGKKRMKQLGGVVIPQEAFLSALKTDD